MHQILYDAEQPKWTLVKESLEELENEVEPKTLHRLNIRTHYFTRTYPTFGSSTSADEYISFKSPVPGRDAVILGELIFWPIRHFRGFFALLDSNNDYVTLRWPVSRAYYSKPFPPLNNGHLWQSTATRSQSPHPLVLFLEDIKNGMYDFVRRGRKLDGFEWGLQARVISLLQMHVPEVAARAESRDTNQEEGT